MLGETEHSPTSPNDKVDNNLVQFLLGEYGLQLEQVMRHADDGRHRPIFIE